MERGEWVIINVNAGAEQHFVLLKPKSKTMSGRNGHIVCPGERNGLCAFTAALHIAKAGGAFDTNDLGVGELTRQEFKKTNHITSITNVRQFATLLQTAALHEQIAAPMYRSEKATERKAAQLEEKGHTPRRSGERPAWLIGHEAVFKARDHMSELERSSSHSDLGVSVAMGESLKAETEFHAQMFGRISDDYSGQGVCSGTWIPVWAAAFGETVHMYEIPAVQPGWVGEATQFPETVFDALDDARRQEQDAERESTGCLRLERGAPLPADQEWYDARFQRAKRGGRVQTTERPTNDEPTPEQRDEPDAYESDVVKITKEAVRDALGRRRDAETPNVPLPSKVGTQSGGVINSSWIRSGASVRCAWRIKGKTTKWFAAKIDRLNEDGTVDVWFTSSKTQCEEINRRDLRQVTEAEAQGGTNLIHEFDTIEAAVAAEVATAGNTSSAQEGSVEAMGVVQ